MLGGRFYNLAVAAEKSGRSSRAVSARQPNFVRRSFTDDAGNEHRYLVFIPHNYQRGKKSPLIIFLNGMGQNGDDGLSQVSNNFGEPAWEMRQFFPFFALAVQCRKNGSWNPESPDAIWALQILDSVIKEFSIDEDRVYLTGVSSGGGGVWAIGSAHLERFAAWVPLCGGGDLTNPSGKSHPPIWSICNEWDDTSLVVSNRQSRVRLIESGLSPLLMEYPLEGHDCWNRGYRSLALYHWLSNQRRTEHPVERLEYLPANRILKEWRQLGSGRWTSPDNVILTTRQSNDRGGSGFLVSNAASAIFEFHGDVWLPTDSICRLALLEETYSESSSGIRVNLVPLEAGFASVSDLEGGTLSRLERAAQFTLRTDAWNDVRVQVVDGRLSLQLNGAVALEGLDLGSSKRDARFRCALMSPDNDAEIRWRYIRLRGFKQDAVSDADPNRPDPLVADALNPLTTEVLSAEKNDQQAATSEVFHEIRSKWESVERQWRGGKFSWRLERQYRSSTFGPLAGSAKSTTTDAESRLLRISFNAADFRLDVPNVSALLSETLGWSEAYGSHFTASEEPDVKQPYTVLVQPQGEIHFRGEASDAWPVRYPLSTVGRNFDNGEPNLQAVALHTGLLDAFRWAIRPTSFQIQSPIDAGKCRLMESRLLLDSHAGICIEESIDRESRGLVRRVWIDPERDGIVTRCAVFTQHAELLHECTIDYDQNDEGIWLPLRLTALAVSKYGDVYNSLVAVRESFALKSEGQAESLAVRFPPGKWVQDAAEGSAHYVRSDRAPPQRKSRNYSNQVQSPGAEIDAAFNADPWNHMNWVVREMVKLFVWPMNLITLPCAVVVFAIARAAWQSSRRRGNR